MSDSSQTLQPTALDMHWVRGEGAAHSTTTNTVKHAQPISTMANLSHPRCHSWPLEATCSDPSRKLLESFPPEVKAAIFLDAMIPCLQSLIHQSSIYTFVPIRRVFAVGKAIATTCRSWRSFYYETVLCFRSNRHGAFIGVTLDELVALRQWLPDVAVVGCLLFLECDPNALLFHSSPEEHRVLRILIRDPVALAAIQVVEWGDHSTNRSASTTVPELNIESFRRIQQLLTEQAHGDHAQVRRLMMEEMTSLSLVLMSNIMSFLAAFPSLKIAEIPTWMLRTLLGFPYDRSHPLSSHLVQSLNLQSVSAQEFAKQCGLVFAHLDGISIVGYPFIIGGLIHNFRQPNPNYKNLILGELEFQSMFRTLHKRLHSPSTYFSHMKAIGWRSNHREELGHFGKILEAIMFFEPRGGLTELCISNKIGEGLSYFAQPPSSNRLIHHVCLLHNRLFRGLPNIEHLALRVPSICREFFKGLYKPQKQHGKFIIVIGHLRKSLPIPCSHSQRFSDFDTIKAVVEILNAGPPCFMVWGTRPAPRGFGRVPHM